MKINVPDNLGMLLLAIWLIATGALPLLNLGSALLSMLLSLTAIAAGVLLLLNR